MTAVEPAAEVIAIGDRVDFMGASFRVADEIGRMPLLKFGKIASQDLDELDMSALAAVYDLLEQCIDPADWPRFENHATKTRADEEQLLEVVGKVLVIVDGRPTRRSSDSSDGPRTIEPSSTDASSSQATALRVIEDLNNQGRPDLALFVRKRQRDLGVLTA